MSSPSGKAPPPVVAAITEQLRSAATPSRAENEKRYLKSDLEHLGATVPHTRKVARSVARDHPALDREALLTLCRDLWATRIHECRAMVVELLDLRAALLLPADLPFVEQLLRESRTWALVDPLAVNVVGALVGAHPALAAELDRWATDADFWVRRASMLALLRPLRSGSGDWDRFTRYAGAMLEEREFFIRKAIGWVLRETARKRPGLVYEWLLPRAPQASGVTVREAVKYLEPAQREVILRARKR